jgi:phosphinothricin acetyltransferase
VWQKELQPAATPPQAVTPFKTLTDTQALRALLG